MLICFSAILITSEGQLRPTSVGERAFSTGIPRRDQGDSEKVKTNSARAAGKAPQGHSGEKLT